MGEISFANPVLVEVTRGALVESRHEGAIAVADADGRLMLALGDVTRPVFPRSAVKALQALPLIESGAAAAFGLVDEDLAVACSSHSGDDVHVAAVRSLLAKAGLDESYLACGVHWPVSDKAARALIKAMPGSKEWWIKETCGTVNPNHAHHENIETDCAVHLVLNGWTASDIFRRKS
jgi:L-asparaginase II